MALVKNTQEITNSTIGPNSFFTGRFHINGSLKIDGKFEGKSLQAEQLYVGATGKLKTDIIATAAVMIKKAIHKTKENLFAFEACIPVPLIMEYDNVMSSDD